MNILKLLKEKHLNIWKTLWFNFSYLPFKQALQFPFYLYGKISTPPIQDKSGLITLAPTYVSQGMVKLGCYKALTFYGDKPTHTTIINIRGHWIIRGSFMLSNGCLVITGVHHDDPNKKYKVTLR